MSMGSRIREARGSRWTQTRLGAELPTVETGLPCAEAIGKSAIAQWESEKKPTIPTLEAIAAASLLLGRSLDHLVFGRSRTLEARIDALPPGFRDTVHEAVLGMVESAEAAAKTISEGAERAIVKLHGMIEMPDVLTQPSRAKAELESVQGRMKKTANAVGGTHGGVSGPVSRRSGAGTRDGSGAKSAKRRKKSAAAT